MYNPLLHKDGYQFSPGYSRSLPRPINSSRLKPGFRARSRSPGRSHLALVICPDFQEYPEGMREYSNPSSPVLSPRASSPHGKSERFPYPPSPRPIHHSVARTRGEYSLRDSNSLPCSPVLNRNPVLRDLSLPGSPVLPRIQIQDYERIFTESEVRIKQRQHLNLLEYLICKLYLIKVYKLAQYILMQIIQYSLFMLG